MINTVLIIASVLFIAVIMFALYMRAKGKEVIVVHNFQALEEAIAKAKELQKPVVIECQIDRDDKVFPMVPAGAPISEAFDGDDLKKKEA